MNYEKSCGAVIYTVVNGKRLYLVEIMQKGHTSFCKGHLCRRSYPGVRMRSLHRHGSVAGVRRRIAAYLQPQL